MNRTSRNFVNYTESRQGITTGSTESSKLTDFHLGKVLRFHRKNLLHHFGCVNAIEFSNDGMLLGSAGDDRRVLLWNVQKAIHSKEHNPTTMQAEHKSNVFAVAFDSKNSKMFTGGNDDQVILHDIETTKPLDYFLFDEPVYGISIEPMNDNVFVTADETGQLLIYDTRDPPSLPPLCLARHRSAFHSVMFSPVEPRLIVSANARTGVALWDIRRPQNSLLNYGGKNSDQSCMSARFSQDGTKILALRRRLPPILYSTDSTNHLFQFTHPGYYNSCTMKSCSFAGSNDQYILSGSDSFDVYMWQIPTEECRRVVTEPRLVESAHMIIHGHRSIVNQVRYNPRYSVIASSGVEKVIKLWSPFPLPSTNANSMFEKASDYARKIYTNNDYINLILESDQFLSLSFDNSRRSTREDQRMLAFFDALVQRDIEGMSDEDDYKLLNKGLHSSRDWDAYRSESAGGWERLGRNMYNDSDSSYRATPERESEHESELEPERESELAPVHGPEIRSAEPEIGLERETESIAEPELDYAPLHEPELASENEQEAFGLEQSVPDESDQKPLKLSPYLERLLDERHEKQERVAPKHDMITRLIATKEGQLLRMARNNIKLEAEGNPRVKRRHMTLLERLKRLNRKTHSLTMNLLPLPEPSSTSSAHSQSETLSVSSVSSSSSSSEPSSSESDDDDDFFKLRDAVQPPRVSPNSELRKKVRRFDRNGSSARLSEANESAPQPSTRNTFDATSPSILKSQARLRKRDSRNKKRPTKRNSGQLREEEDEQPSTSATARKEMEMNKKRRTANSDSTTTYSSEDPDNRADFIAKLEEVSKRLKRVTSDLTSSASLLRNTRYNNPKKKRQSTMIRSPTSSSLSSSTSSSSKSSSAVSSSESEESYILTLPELPKLPDLPKLPNPIEPGTPKTDSESDSDSSDDDDDESTSSTSTTETEHDDDASSWVEEKIKQIHQRPSRNYRKRKESMESDDSS